MVRRDVFEAVGGFDERYFMFAEDMALCWRPCSWSDVAAVPEARVTHVEGLSRRRESEGMLIAHHRSAMRFDGGDAEGFDSILRTRGEPVLGLRLWRGPGHRPPPEAALPKIGSTPRMVPGLRRVCG